MWFLHVELVKKAKGLYVLKSFSVDGFTIKLIPSPPLGSSGEALFAADSMTLLVGPNGCGKTRAMIALASAVSRKASSHKTVWGSEQEQEATCVVYYTSAPYHIDMPRSGERFRSIKTSSSSIEKPLSAEHRYIANQLEEEFGLRASRTFSLQSISEYEFREIMSRAVREGVVNSWVESFRIADEKYLQEMRLPEGASRDWTKLDSISKARDKLASDFAVALREQIGKDFSLKIRAYQSARSGRALSTNAQKQLLEQLGFVHSKPPPKRASVPLEKFLRTLEKLRTVAEIVEDPLLTKSSYAIDDKQVEQLKGMQLGKLGQLSLTGLSSGAAALIHQFSSIDWACEELLGRSANRNLLLLIDEGDAFLHLGWQQRYIDYLDKTVIRLKQKFESVQVVIASHSPVLMSDFPKESICLMERRDWMEDLAEGVAPQMPSESFGAPLDTVVRHVGQAGTMGKFATRVIRHLVQDVAARHEIDPRRVEMLGDPIIKRQVIKALEDRKSWGRKE